MNSLCSCSDARNGQRHRDSRQGDDRAAEADDEAHHRHVERDQKRLSGLRSSPRMRPRTKIAASAGVSVTASRAAKPIEYVLVKASGRNSRPSTRLAA